MTKVQAIKEFECQYYQLYVDRVDYWTAQEKWAAYTDELRKDRAITQYQWNIWSAPFLYGKHLEPSKEQLEMALKFSH